MEVRVGKVLATKIKMVKRLASKKINCGRMLVNAR
jgi:hypothetical protein